MLFAIDFKSGKAVYLQIVEQVRAAAAAGTLRPGDALPSIRALAEDLRLNRNTVAKAFGELEAQGVVETAQGKGCFVSAAGPVLRKDARRRALGELLDAVIVQAHHLQVDRTDFLRIAEERFDAMEQRRSRADSGGIEPSRSARSRG